MRDAHVVAPGDTKPEEDITFRNVGYCTPIPSASLFRRHAAADVIESGQTPMKLQIVFTRRHSGDESVARLHFRKIKRRVSNIILCAEYNIGLVKNNAPRRSSVWSKLVTAR